MGWYQEAKAREQAIEQEHPLDAERLEDRVAALHVGNLTDREVEFYAHAREDQPRALELLRGCARAVQRGIEAHYRCDSRDCLMRLLDTRAALREAGVLEGGDGE